MIEIAVPKFETIDEREILINRTPKTNCEESGGGGMDCSDCSKETLAKVHKFHYGFTARFFRMGKNKEVSAFRLVRKKVVKDKRFSWFTADRKPKFN